MNKIKFFAVALGIVIASQHVANASQDITISSLEYSSFDQGQNLIVNGSGFGPKSDNGGVKNYLPRLWDDFESASFVNWQFWGDGSSWEISTNVVRPNSHYSAHKKNENPLDAMVIHPSSQQQYYVSFWMYLPSNLPIGNNIKYFRAGSTPSHANLVMNSNSNSSDFLSTVEFAAGGTQVNYGSFPKERALGAWTFFEIMWALPVLGSSDDYVKIYANGSLVNSLPVNGRLWPDGEEMDNSPYISIGTWFSTALGIGDGFYFDDVYIDYSQARIMLGDAPFFGSSSHREMLIPTSWSDNSISAMINVGSFHPGDIAYLYVIDADGHVSNNGKGVEITVGNPGNAISPPDNNSPDLAFIEPTSASVYVVESADDQQIINIKGSASDDNTIQSVTYSTDNNQNGTAYSTDGFRNWSVPIMIHKNETVITTITATDDAGQSTSKTMTITCTCPVGWDATVQTGDSTWADSSVTYCVRLLVQGDSITDSADQVVLGFQGRSRGNYTIRNVSIAQRDPAGGRGDVLDDTWRQVTFGGAQWGNPVTIGSGGEKYSDPIRFNLQPGTDYYVTFKIDSPSVYLDPPADYQELYFTSEDHTSDIDWSENGHSVTHDYHALSKIYIYSRLAGSLFPPASFHLQQ